MTDQPETTTYRITGSLGDDTALGDLDLGTEVLLVVRGVVSKLADTLDDGVVVCAATVRVVTAATIGDRSTLATAARKRLADAAGQLDV